MGRYLVVRFLLSVFSLFCIASILFWVIELMPGSAFHDENQLNPVVKKKMESFFGGGNTAWGRYAYFLKGSSQGMLGPSMVHSGDMADILLPKIRSTFLCGTSAFFVALIFGGAFVYLSLISSFFKMTYWRVLQILLSIPNLVLGTFLIYFLGVRLQILPVARVDEWTGWILPIFLLSIRPMLSFSRVLLVNIEKIDCEQFVQNAKVQGFAASTIRKDFLIRNSLVPFFSLIPGWISHLLGGSLLIETMFAISGIGSFYLSALINKDVFIIVGLTMMFATILTLTQLCVDIAIVLVDPRVRLFEGKTV